MKIGAVFPHLEIGHDPVVIRDWAQAAEEIGYSHLLVYDHVIGAVHEGREPKLWGPYTEGVLFPRTVCVVRLILRPVRSGLVSRAAC